MSWQGLRIQPSAAPDAIIQALFDAGAIAVQEDADGVVTHFPPETDIGKIRRRLSAADPGAAITLFDTPDIRIDALHGTVSVQRLGKITVAPPWESAAINDPGLVVINPAMGFGTGEHPTTRGVIRLIQEVMQVGDTVADLGAGSAVLSIAAARLGASRVYAIENDAEAIGNAEENVRGNRVGNVVSVLEGDAAAILPLVGPVSLVLANIISSVLMELMPVIHSGTEAGGHAILSGILNAERDQVADRAKSAGFTPVAEDAEGEWWSVLLRRR